MNNKTLLAFCALAVLILILGLANLWLGTRNAQDTSSFVTSRINELTTKVAAEIAAREESHRLLSQASDGVARGMKQIEERIEEVEEKIKTLHEKLSHRPASVAVPVDAPGNAINPAGPPKDQPTTPASTASPSNRD